MPDDTRAVLIELLAVVGRNDHHGIVQQPPALEVSQHLADQFVVEQQRGLVVGERLGHGVRGVRRHAACVLGRVDHVVDGVIVQKPEK